MNAFGLLPGSPHGLRHALAAILCMAAVSGGLAQAQLAITTSSLPPATPGVPYSATLSATGGMLPYTWSTGGGLPQGLMLNSGSPSATITGTPAAPPSGVVIDPRLIQFEVTDAQGLMATAFMSIIVQNPIVITTSSLPSGTVGAAYFSCLSATGGGLAQGEFWAMTGGSLPTGLSFGSNPACPGPGSSPSAAISGTPTQSGNFNLTVQVSDAQSGSAQEAYTLTVGAPPPTATLSAGPGTISAGYTQGGAALAPQGLVISSSGSALAYNSSVSYVAGASGNSAWVNLTNPSGITPGTVTVTLNPSGLPAGVYQANIAIASSASNSPLSVPVGLTVTSGITLILSPATVTFTYVQGAAAPPSQQVQFTTSSGSLTYNFSVSPVVSWLAVIPPGGVNPSSLVLSVNPAALDVGRYSTTIQVFASGAVNSPQPLDVTLMVQAATPAITSVLNGASLEVEALAPGTILTIKGSALGPSAGVSAQPNANGDYGTTLGGVQVLFDGVAGAMLYAQSGQINAIVPFGVSGQPSTNVQVAYQSLTSASYSLPLQPAAPALFTASAAGAGQGAFLNQDYSVNSSSNPASAGTIVALFGTGGGLFQTTLGDGTTAGVTNLSLPVTAQVGGATAQVEYAGSAPGLVAGGVQINVKIPPGTAAGNVPIVVLVNGVPSQSPVTVAVH